MVSAGASVASAGTSTAGGGEVVAVLVGSPVATSFRGPLGTGAAAQGLPAGDGPLTLELAWKRLLGSGYSGISLADGKLVTAFSDGLRDYVVALDPADGAELWRYDLSPVYKGHDGSHDGPIATPALADGRVFMLGAWGHLAAIDLTTGEELWTAHLVEDFGSEPQYYGFAASPLVVGDTLVVQIGGEEGAVAGFDVASGELRWRSFEDETMAQSPIPAEFDGRRQVLVLGSTKLAGVDPSDGAVLWEFEHDGEPGPMGSWTSSPLPLGDGRIFVKHEDPSTQIVELAGDAGTRHPRRLVESRGLSRTYSPAAPSGDSLYGFTARFLSALDPASGELLWRTREVGDGFVITIDDHLAIVQKTGTLHLGPASPDGWSETARMALFEDLAWTPPSYADGSIYARSLGEIARVDLVRGAADPGAVAAGAELPPPLVELAERIGSTNEPGDAVDAFLADRDLPLVDGDQVVFLWRGPAEDVAIAGDMIGMRREEPMRRLEGTELWWWATELDRHARISYMFIPDFEPTTDPSHDRVVTATVLGPDMNWRRGEGARMSWFAMPDWPGHASGGPARAVTAERPGGGGRLETVEIEIRPAAAEGAEAAEPVQVPAHVWLPPGYDDGDDRYPVVYVQTPAAREAGAWPRTLDRVVGDTVAPVIVVFPEWPRMRGLGGTFAAQFVPRVDELFRTRRERESRAVVAMGWNGFGATSLVFGHPELFGALGVQSMYLLDENKGIIERAIGEQTAASTPLRIYLEWGRWDLVSPHEEMNMRASSRWAWERFEAGGWRPMGGEVWDSTDFASWTNRTEALLAALFPAGESDGGLAAWLTGR